MKKTIYSVMLTAAIAALSCDNETRKAKETTRDKNETEIAGTPETQLPAADDGQEKNATAELCKCVNASLAGMSPKVRQILIDASKSANPIAVLTTELQKVNSNEEQENLAKEFQQFENDPALQRCSEDIMKKYNLNGESTASQQKFLKAAADNKECEITSALIKIGLQYEKQSSGRTSVGPQ